MAIGKDDLKLWEDFKSNLEKSKKVGNGRISETGKKIIRLIKENMKNRKCDDVAIGTFDDGSDFVLEKGKSLGIDRMSDRKLSQGKFKIDYRLDLHGSTLEQAYGKIKNLFERADLNNYKCLLIITGKGLHSTDRTIKNSISDWFKEPYFSSRIIKYIDANATHGGSGAIYVLLKNRW